MFKCQISLFIGELAQMVHDSAREHGGNSTFLDVVWKLLKRQEMLRGLIERAYEKIVEWIIAKYLDFM